MKVNYFQLVTSKKGESVRKSEKQHENNVNKNENDALAFILVLCFVTLKGNTSNLQQDIMNLIDCSI